MVSKYQMIKEDIIKEINEGVFLPGDKIYSEADLKKKYNVSNTTVVKALNNLVSEGYLIRRQGYGTFVRRNLINRKVLFSETSPVSSMKGKVVERTETHVSESFKDKEVAKKLGDLQGEENIIKIIQVAYVNDIPWKIQNRYLLERKIPETGIENIKHGASVTKEISGNYNIHAEMSVNIVRFEPTSKELKIVENYLKEQTREEEDLVFFDIQKITTSLNGEILEYTRSFIDPHYYSIQITTE